MKHRLLYNQRSRPLVVRRENAAHHTGHFADPVDGHKLGLHVFQFTPLIPQNQLLTRDGSALLVQPENAGDIQVQMKLNEDPKTRAPVPRPRLT